MNRSNLTDLYFSVALMYGIEEAITSASLIRAIIMCQLEFSYVSTSVDKEVIARLLKTYRF